MSRMLITVFLTYVFTRLAFWIFGFNPVRDLPSLAGYLVDFGIWMLACYLIYRFLSVLRIGRPSRKRGQIKT